MRFMKFVAIAFAALLAACGDSTDDRRVVGELASDRIELTAEVNEPILEILVAEGETVSAGQLILRQDTDRGRARLAEAKATAGQARARLDELIRGPREEQIRQGRANLDGAERDVAYRELGYARASELLEEELEGRANGLRGNMVVVTDALGDKLQTLEDMVLAVSTMAEEAVAKLAQDVEDHRSDQWSDWGILADQGFQMLQSRVADLEANPAVSAAEVQELRHRVRELSADTSTGFVLGLQTELQSQMKEVLEKGGRLLTQRLPLVSQLTCPSRLPRLLDSSIASGCILAN